MSLGRVSETMALFDYRFPLRLARLDLVLIAYIICASGLRLVYWVSSLGTMAAALNFSTDFP